MTTAVAWSLADGDNLDRYFALTDEQRDQLYGWFTLHDVDYNDVPLTARIELDEATREWRIPVYLRNADGARYVRDDGEVASAVLRRAWRADPPALEPSEEALAEIKAARREIAAQTLTAASWTPEEVAAHVAANSLDDRPDDADA